MCEREGQYTGRITGPENNTRLMVHTIILVVLEHVAGQVLFASVAGGGNYKPLMPARLYKGEG